MGRFYGWEQGGIRANGLTPADIKDVVAGLSGADNSAQVRGK